tara:strand:- start:2263 stop:2487 length:225 start_codon:yes stop_codon:yes gene_type:complete
MTFRERPNSIPDWKFPGGYYKDDEFIHYKGVEDPMFIKHEKKFHEDSVNGWWWYHGVANKFKPKVFRTRRGGSY